MKTTRALLPVLLVLLLATPARADTAGRIAGYDVMVRAGRPAKLRAKLESKGMLSYSGVENESIDYWLVAEPAKDGKPGTQTLENAKFLGSGRTDASGIGELEWTPEAAGSYEVEARVRKGSPYVAVPAPVEVLVAAHDRLLAIASIEGTLTDMGWLKLMAKDAKDIPVVEGAADALKKLSEKRAVVYMTGLNEDWSLVKTKEWLALRGFPRGPVFFWSTKESLSGEKYKTELVSRLHADFPHLTAGIGGKPEDAKAYIANGVTGYLLGSDSDAPPDAILVKWDKLDPAVDRQREVEALVSDLASLESAKQEKARAELAKVETRELGYFRRLVRAADVSTAAAARLALARIRARDAFAASLDLTTDGTALSSVIAAWRSGDATVCAKLYREGASGFAKAGPPLEKWRGIEIVNRSEPEPGKVVYRLRFLADDAAKNAERDFVFLRQGDGAWRVDVGDF